MGGLAKTTYIASGKARRKKSGEMALESIGRRVSHLVVASLENRCA
jgi:hypothetical protein